MLTTQIQDTMSQPKHTFGPTCHLSRSVALSGSKENDDIPDLRAQFFYRSPLPIDDPLSNIPVPAGSESRAVKHPPRPFSVRDNKALEKAWLSLASEKDRKSHNNGKTSVLSFNSSATASDNFAGDKHESHGPSDKLETGSRKGSGKASCNDHKLRRGAQGAFDKKGNNTSSSIPINTRLIDRDDIDGNSSSPSDAKRRVRDETLKAGLQSSMSTTPTSQFGSFPRQGVKAGTTGLPFLKYHSPVGSYESQPPNASSSDEIDNLDPVEDSFRDNRESCSETEQTQKESNCTACNNPNGYADVPVGFSKLHLVKLPALQMYPIYWSPVHDISSVTRATWFYKETMYPVEPGVANQLEMGYKELRPWSQTWSDELNSALEIGAAGEEKITHQLWPVEEPVGASEISQSGGPSAGPHCTARCFHGEAATEGSPDLDESQAGSGLEAPVKIYPESHVIYSNPEVAFILKPNLQPSAYYGRRPLQKIRRGFTVGIPVVRGFDWNTWGKLHPSSSRKSKLATRVEGVTPIAGDTDASKRSFCAACNSQEESSNVTDLILVIHGIGQKLSERVESFHFTHSINSFRRSINVELCNEGVQRVLRDELGGVMVLPVNWRSNLSFEDGGPLKDDDKEPTASNFILKDITPETIPAVRNLISDVMLDIPFYMSHHKPKMIQAVTSEANRVYRLWCKNNPGFHEYGRVHIIAHSLGSAMAVEVLSKQPTHVPKIDPYQKINTKYFDFDTTNLFFCGSPAGFFLLLDKGNLVPRRGQNKPGASRDDDNDPAITGSAGAFGCLAVDNIYNVMHYNDPIAYRLNATIDPQYATSLKNAQVPSATAGFFESIGNAMKSITPGFSAPADLAVGQVPKPAVVTRLPSQLEMAVHDFTREEIAEKKFSLLNDNCQVDWFLSTGGGPLEIQYINMLSAHSSYWGSHDFIRMVVIECGRKPGKGNVLPNMRAIKVGHK
jgi:hypothetical protein